MLSEKEQALFDAINQGNMEQMEALLKEGVNVDTEDQNGNPPIELIASKHNIEGLKILLKYNPTVRYNNIEELRKHMPGEKKILSTESRDFIGFEILFHQENYKDIKDTISIIQGVIKEGNLSSIQREENKYKQIEDFVKLKIEALSVSNIKNDQTSFSQIYR
jgi:ankyrin repeat protein